MQRVFVNSQPIDRTNAAGQAVSPAIDNGGLRLSYLGADEVPVLELSGEFDFGNVPEIERLLRRRLGPFFFKGRDLVLDLALVELVDSAFVGLVVSLARRLHANRRELLITRPVGYARRTLALVGLPNLVPVYDSIDDALAALSGGAPLIPPPFDLGRLAATSPTTP
jgi:anti-anti-sigma factor